MNCIFWLFFQLNKYIKRQKHHHRSGIGLGPVREQRLTVTVPFNWSNNSNQRIYYIYLFYFVISYRSIYEMGQEPKICLFPERFMSGWSRLLGSVRIETWDWKVVVCQLVVWEWWELCESINHFGGSFRH